MHVISIFKICAHTKINALRTCTYGFFGLVALEISLTISFTVDSGGGRFPLPHAVLHSTNGSGRDYFSFTIVSRKFGGPCREIG